MSALVPTLHRAGKRMKLTANNFEIWTFRRNPDVEYLLMRTSQEKADRFFGGGRFWQVPTDAVGDDEEIEGAANRIANDLGLKIIGLWAAEHTYTIYNRRRREVAIIPVFAAQVQISDDLSLTWEHSEAGWYSANACLERVHFRGTREGLQSVREYVTETSAPAQELRLI